MKMASASASTSEPMVKYRPRNRSIGTETISANTTATTPAGQDRRDHAPPARDATSAVPYEPTPTNAATASDTMPP